MSRMELGIKRPLLAVAAVLAVLLAGWFLSGSMAEPDDVAVADTARAGSGKGGIPKEDLKIGVVYLSDPAEGAGYTYTHDLGIQEMQLNIGLKDEQILRLVNVADNDEAQIEAALQECVDKKCNIVFATSFGYMDMVEKFAAQHPEIHFFHATGYKSNNTNFNNYFGRIYQPRYLSGLVAGSKTKSNMIGYVAAMGSENAEVTGGIDAFAMGIYAVNPQAKVYVKVTNSWFDPVKEKEASEQLLAMGCDVMSQHCDTAYPMKLAEDKGVWGVGYNSDMRKQTPGSALVSVIWHWGAFYTDAVQQLMDGTWQPHNYYEGMSEGIVGITELSDENDARVKELVSQAELDILQGRQKVFTGVIETNDGGTVGTAGQDFSDGDITGNLHWYFKNVVIVP